MHGGKVVTEPIDGSRIMRRTTYSLVERSELEVGELV